MLRKIEVVENRPGRRDAAREVVHAETLERLGAELLAELLAVHLLGKDPFVQLVGVELVAEGLRETLLIAALVDHLLGLQVRDKLVHIVVRPFGRVEFAGRDIEKRHTGRPSAEADRGDVVVLLVGQDVVSHDNAGRYEFDHTALDKFLDELRVLQLFADRHTFTGPHQFRQIGVDGMVGKSSQLDIRGGAVGPPRERDAQNAARLDRIFAEGLVEVAHTEEQDGVGMHRLDGVILLHQGRFDIFLIVFFLLSHNRIL